MNFDKNETQTMLIDSAARLIKTRSSVEKWRARRTNPNGFDAAAWAQFAELGWLALPIPEDAGGLSGSPEDVALLMVELGKGLVIEPYVSTVLLCGHILDVGAPGKQRETLLAEIAAGDVLLALAHAETTDRYETATPRATSARNQNGSYRLSGNKMLVLDGPAADQFLVTASVDNMAGTAIFLVPKTAAGVSLSPYPLIDGSHAADLMLDQVELPKEALIVAGDTGAEVLAEATDRASVALVAQAVGSMESCLEICGAYLKERKQFGQPLANFQVLQHMSVDMLVAAHQTRSIVYQALSYMNGTAADRARAVSSARIVAAQAMQTVSRLGIQLHGGYGVTDEYAISHHYRRLLVIEKMYGDTEFHTTRLADFAFGVPKAGT